MNIILALTSTPGKISSCGYYKKTEEHIPENEHSILHVCMHMHVCICMFVWGIKYMEMRQKKHAGGDRLRDL